MTIRVSRYNMDDLIALFPVLFGILIAMAILAWVAVYFVKRMDNNKPLITRRVKILEKIYSLGEIEWYVVEFENGERLKLRNLNAHKMILSAGDVGILRYKGMTIDTFIVFLQMMTIALLVSQQLALGNLSDRDIFLLCYGVLSEVETLRCETVATNICY